MSFAFFFPGQGSQSLNMMDGFAGQSVVKNTFDEASAVLGQDLWAMINGTDADLIGQTVNTQPSLPATASVNTLRLSPPVHWILRMQSNSSACVPN